MKGKRLLILGAAFALGLSACASAIKITRTNPLREGETITYDATSFSELATGDVGVIVGNNGSNYALSNNNGTSSAPTAVAVVALNGKLSGTIPDTVLWTVTVSDSGYQFTVTDDPDENKLYCTNTNNGIRVGTNANNVFTIDSQSNYLLNSGTSRYVGIYNSADWRCYTSVNSNIAGQTFSFYKKTVNSGSEPEKVIEELQFVGNPTKTSYYVGENWDLSGISLRAKYEDNSLEVLGSVPELVASNNLSITISPASANSTDITYFHLNGTYLVNSMTVYPRQVNGITVSLKSGSEAKPYTVAEARDAIDNNGDKTGVYATGVVSRIVTAYSTQFNNITYNFSEDGSTSSPQLQAYRGVGGAVSITSESDVLVGDKVVVSGNLKKYNSTYEFDAGNTLVARKHIQSVTIKTAPNKTTYDAGETFSAAGLVLTVNWDADDYADYSYAQYSSMISFNTNALTTSNSGDFAISIFGKTVNQVIVVNDVQAVTSVSVEPASFALEVGKTQQLTTTVTVESGAPQTVNYTSSNASVATVNNNGVVTAVGTGVAKITATSTFDNTKFDSSVVAVINPVDSASTAYNAVMKYSGSTTGNMTATGNASNVGLDAIVFSVDAGAGETTNLPGLNKAGDMRLYSLKSAEATGNGSYFTVSVLDGYEIQYIEIDFAENEQYATVYAGSDVTNGIDGNYSINSTSFKVENGYVSDGSVNPQVHINKITIHYISVGGSTITPDNYLESASSYASIHGVEHTSQDEVMGNITFASLGLTNGVQYSDPFNIGNGGATIKFSGGGNDGKYYTTGSGVRTYGGGSFTIAAPGNISEVVLTWDNTDGCEPTSGNVVNNGEYDPDTKTWSGSAQSITFTRPSGTGHWRLQAVTVTYIGGAFESVDSISLEFGGKISKSNWDAIEDNSDWPINEFGIMLFKTRLDSVPTVKAVYEGTPSKVICVSSTQYGVTLEEDGDNYKFSVKVSISSESNYDIYFCAIPYVVVDGEYYYLGNNMKFSVQTLAKECLENGGSDLSDEALTILKGNLGD